MQCTGKWPIVNIVDTINNCKMHPPDRETNFGCSFGSVNTWKKIVPGCKIYTQLIMGTWSTSTVFTGMRQVYITVGAMFLKLS